MKLIVRAKQCFVVATLIFQLLNGTLLGVLVTTVAAYSFTALFTNLGTLSLWELVLWVDSQSTETKALLLPSALTVIGFLVAFQTATKNWKDAMRAELRLKVAEQLMTVHGRASTLATALRLYADTHLQTLERIAKGEEEQALLVGAVRYAVSLNEKFMRDRQGLWEAHGAACGIVGGYGSVLFAIPNGLHRVAEINDAIASIATRANVRVLSEKVADEPACLALFAHFTDAEKLKELRDYVANVEDFISGNSGAVRGILTAPVMDLTWGFVANFVRDGDIWLRAMDAAAQGKPVDLSAFDDRSRFKW